jgi:TfoX/Sxy family transcriptional regulator of competence genes
MDDVMTDAQAMIAVMAERVRDSLTGSGQIREQRMFGGIGFLLEENFLCHVSRKGVMVRVGREREAKALAKPHATLCRQGKRAMPGFIQVAPDGLRTTRDLNGWLKLGCDYLATLEPNSAKKRRRA